jgi:pre-mRNA-splicing helicase BRR2
MGSRVQRQDLDKKKATNKQETTDKQVAKQKTETAGFGYTDIIEATRDVEGLTYWTRTAETHEVYEIILSTALLVIKRRILFAVPPVLETLKNENMKDFDKKREVGEVLGSITNEH